MVQIKRGYANAQHNRKLNINRETRGRRSATIASAHDKIAGETERARTRATDHWATVRDVVTKTTVLGRPQIHDCAYINASKLETEPGWLHVPSRYVKRAQYGVPGQVDGRSCGPNSCARFAIMLGQPMGEYGKVLEKYPWHQYFGLIGRVCGGNADRTAEFLDQHPALQATCVGQFCSKHFHPVFETITDALKMGRPSMALLYHSQTSLHWVNVVGYHTTRGCWAILNTNGELEEHPHSALEHRMNCDDSWIQKLGKVERYNAVIANHECNYRE